jgi:hypothetical protein
MDLQWILAIEAASGIVLLVRDGCRPDLGKPVDLSPTPISGIRRSPRSSRSSSIAPRWSAPTSSPISAWVLAAQLSDVPAADLAVGDVSCVESCASVFPGVPAPVLARSCDKLVQPYRSVPFSRAISLIARERTRDIESRHWCLKSGAT